MSITKFIKKLTTSTLAVLLMVSVMLPASTAQAATVAEMQAMIDQLMQQINSSGTTVSEPPIATVPSGVSGGTAGKFATFKQSAKEITVDDETELLKGKLRPVAYERNLNKIVLHVSPGKTNSIDDPWTVFDGLFIYVNGYHVRTVNTDDKANWRLVGSRKGAPVYEITVYQGNIKLPSQSAHAFDVSVDTVDGADSDMWSVWVPKNGITTWSRATKHVSYGPSRVFSYMLNTEKEEATGQLTFSVGKDNPDASTLVGNNSVNILSYEMELEGVDEVELEQLGVLLSIKGDTFDHLINDVVLVIDGKEFDLETYTALDRKGEILAIFDIDGDIVLEEDEPIVANLYVEIADKESGNPTIQASVNKDAVQLTKYSSSENLLLRGVADGEIHTVMFGTGAQINFVDANTTVVNTVGSSTYGKFVVEFDVTAIEDDIYVKRVANKGGQKNPGVSYVLEGPGEESVTAIVESSASTVGNYYLIQEGETETIELVTTVMPKTNGRYRMAMTGLTLSPEPNDNDTRTIAVEKNSYATPYVSLTAQATVVTSPKINAFTVSPSKVASGQQVKFSWSTTGVSNCYITDSKTGGDVQLLQDLNLNGSISAVPNWRTGETSKTYSLVCQDASTLKDRVVEASVRVELTSAVATTTPVTKPPMKNVFGCDRNVAAPLANATVACYGMWDYGEDFGGDVNECRSDTDEAKTGCMIKAPVCASGSAMAQRYLSNADLKPENLLTISRLLKTTPDTVKKGVAGLWVYRCAAETPAAATSTGVAGTAQVLGASTSIFTQTATVINAIKGYIDSLKR